MTKPTPESRKSVYLVDGSSYLFRAFHALPDLKSSDGHHTGAMIGVANMIKKLVDDCAPDYLAVVFDAKGKNFRHELYPDYKANRPPMPDELRCQIEPLHDIIRAMGWPLVSISGVEADDVIGTLAKQAKQQGYRCVISTGDKDMAQLVEDDISLINTMTNVAMDAEAVVAKFGVTPEQIIDYLALVGDTSDNIPGVPKVGPKTAAKWLAKYQTMDAIVDDADNFGGKIGEHLRGALDQLPLSRQLTTIKLDVDTGISLADLSTSEPDLDTLIPLLKQFELKRWLDQFAVTDSPTTTAVEKPVAEYETIFNKADLGLWLKKLAAADYFAFDLETTSVDYMQAEIVGLSFSCEAGKAAYVPVAHNYPGVPEQLDRDWVLEQFKPLLEDKASQIIGQHFKYDMNVLSRHGIDCPGPAWDTMLESYVFNASSNRHNMDVLAEKYLGRQTIHFEDVAGKGAKQLTFDQVEIDIASTYAAEDADITLQLHQTLWPQLEVNAKQARVFTDIEMPLVPVLSRMETTGVLIDSERLLAHSRELEKTMYSLEKQCHEIAGHPFNLGSPKQLQQILFEELSLPIIRKTPKGQPSTAEDVLQELAEHYPLPSHILEYRSLSKLKSTYTDRLPERVDAKTGRVHTSYHQAVAATGRLSSSDPNLQNIPIRTAEGRRVRQAFIAPPGSKVLAADYSQIELRIMAHLSQDPGLLDAFNNGVDIHSATAIEVFGAKEDGNASTEHRRAAKAINFGLMYGMSAFGLGRQLHIGRQEAQEYIDIYFARYPKVQDFMNDTRSKASEQGFVETLFGRRLYLPEINARNGQRRQAAERAAINAPMQGTAADIIKRAMIEVDTWLSDKQEIARLTMQVHDELVLEVREEHLQEIERGVVERMAAAASLKVPLIVDTGIGINWDEAH